MTAWTSLASTFLVALRRGWFVGVVAASAVLFGVISYVQSQPSVYATSAVVVLRPKGDRPVSAQVVLLAAPRYVAYATSPYALRRVAKTIEVDSSTLERAVVVTMPPTTANMTITVTLTDPAAAAQAANEIAAAVEKRASSDPILAAQTVSSAGVPTQPSGPARLAMLAAGGLVALIAGLVAVLSLHWSRPWWRRWRNRRQPVWTPAKPTRRAKSAGRPRSTQSSVERPASEPHPRARRTASNSDSSALPPSLSATVSTSANAPKGSHQ